MKLRLRTSLNRKTLKVFISLDLKTSFKQCHVEKCLTLLYTLSA